MQSPETCFCAHMHEIMKMSAWWLDLSEVCACVRHHADQGNQVVPAAPTSVGRPSGQWAPHARARGRGQPATGHLPLTLCLCSATRPLLSSGHHVFRRPGRRPARSSRRPRAGPPVPEGTRPKHRRADGRPLTTVHRLAADLPRRQVRHSALPVQADLDDELVHHHHALQQHGLHGPGEHQGLGNRGF